MGITAVAFRSAVAAADDRLGGPARRRAILLLAAVLSLESADLGTIGAVATQLEKGFNIQHTQLGLLASVSLLVGGVATVPFGMLADRTARVRLLVASIALWSAAMIAVGASPSYGWLIVSRVGLGAVMAAAGPVVASLMGDLFAPEERARVYGYVLTGEFVGAAVGFLVSGNVGAALSWRFAFWTLSVPGFVLAYALWRMLPEPHRRPDRTELKLVSAVRYVLRIRTNVILIAASALGYFFFAGMRTFAIAFLTHHFGLSQSVATMLLVGLGLGSVAGVLLGGRVADRLMERGRVDGRIVVPTAAYVAAALVLAPAIASSTLVVAAPLFVLGGLGLSAVNPPLDAARLDIVPPRLWGRAESVRTVLRQIAQAGAPLLFGVVADALGGRGSHGSGLEYAFLIMLVPLGLTGAVVWRARRSYPRDAAAAHR